MKYREEMQQRIIFLLSVFIFCLLCFFLYVVWNEN